MLSQKEFIKASLEIEAQRRAYPGTEIVFSGSNETCGLFCEAGISKIAVLPNGDIYPCGLFIGTPSGKIGTVKYGIDSKMLKSILEIETVDADKYYERCVACKLCVQSKRKKTDKTKSELSNNFLLNPNLSIRSTKKGKIIHTGQRILAVNELGALIIDSVIDGLTKKQIVQKIEQRYSEKNRKITEDVNSFMTYLQKNGILVENEGPVVGYSNKKRNNVI